MLIEDIESIQSSELCSKAQGLTKAKDFMVIIAGVSTSYHSEQRS